jgi:hypothetical protein
MYYSSLNEMNFCLIPKMLVVWIEVSSHNVAGVRSDCSNDKDLAVSFKSQDLPSKDSKGAIRWH